MIKKKGFTLIELIVVIAILGVLVLLALPGLLSHSEKARIAHITNDIKAHENAIEAERVNNDSFTEGWLEVNSVTLDNYRNSNELYDKRGLIEDKDYEFNDEYFIINSNVVNTKLTGDFILNKGSGKVYYHDEATGDDVAQAKPACNIIDESEGNGSGTAEDPYIVRTTEDFLDISRTAVIEIGEYGDEYYMQYGHFKLGEDIDMNGVKWEELGNFMGVLDGNDCTIENLELNNSYLFSNVDNAVIENIHFENIDVDFNDLDYGSFGTAALFSTLKNSTINNMSIEGSYTSVAKVEGLSTYMSSNNISNMKININMKGKEIMGIGSTAFNTNFKNVSANVVAEGENVYGLFDGIYEGSSLESIDLKVNLKGDENIFGLADGLYGSEEKINVKDVHVKGEIVANKSSLRRNVAAFIEQSYYTDMNNISVDVDVILEEDSEVNTISSLGKHASNLDLKDVESNVNMIAKGNNKAENLVGLISGLYDSNVENVKANTNIEGDLGNATYIGGLTQHSGYSILKDNEVNLNIENVGNIVIRDIGGLSSQAYGGEIANNDVNLTLNFNFIELNKFGGLLGETNGDISDNNVNVEMTAQNTMFDGLYGANAVFGGLVGEALGGINSLNNKVNLDVNLDEVSGSANIGGAVGQTSGAGVKDIIATGNLFIDYEDNAENLNYGRALGAAGGGQIENIESRLNTNAQVFAGEVFGAKLTNNKYIAHHESPFVSVDDVKFVGQKDGPPAENSIGINVYQDGSVYIVSLDENEFSEVFELNEESSFIKDGDVVVRKVSPSGIEAEQFEYIQKYIITD